MSTVKLTYKAKIKHIFHRVSTVYNTSLISIANTHFLNKTKAYGGYYMKTLYYQTNTILLST